MHVHCPCFAQLRLFGRSMFHGTLRGQRSRPLRRRERASPPANAILEPFYSSIGPTSSWMSNTTDAEGCRLLEALVDVGDGRNLLSRYRLSALGP